MVPRTLDLVARHKSEYDATRSPRLVNPGPGRYLALAGRGDAGGEAFRRQADGLLALARSVRAVTAARGKTFRLPPLEVLRRCDGAEPAGEESWKLLLRVPNFVRSRDLAAAAAGLEGRLGAGVREVKVEELREGRCVQALHVGPPATEPDTVSRMRRAAADLGLAFHGKRHEIRLWRQGRASPERRRTILRQPVRAVR